MHITAPNVAVVVYRTSYLVKFNAVTGRGSSPSCCSILFSPLFRGIRQGGEILIRGVISSYAFADTVLVSKWRNWWDSRRKIGSI